ncbi:MAG: hypothetical protein IJL73_01515 [Lachnospiraceae bacterium]|nr:hypothetical protein [Lachnospiraceae bacterium]
MRQAPKETDSRARFKSPPPEILKRLALSRKKAERLITRELHCPVCGFLVQIIPREQTDIVFVKCRKCKFSGPVDPTLFNTQNRPASYCEELKEGPSSGER